MKFIDCEVSNQKYVQATETFKTVECVQFWFQNRTIPTICLLIKDHKTKDATGNFLTHLVVPAKNFTAGFPHVGQRGIKVILDTNEINYTEKKIVQASNLKQQLETLNINSSKHTMASIDTKNMYPSVKFGQIKKAVNYFLHEVSDADK